MSKRLGLALLLPTLAVASCSCGTGVGKAKDGTLTGSVFKGPVATADVVAFDGNSGRRGEQIGAGKTADDGTFNISVGSHEGPIVVCATKGTYTEEATGGLVQLGANELCGLVTAHEAGATSNVVITPLTTLHTALTGCFVDAGRDAEFASAERHSALRLNDFFAAGQTNFDIRGLLPLDPTTVVAPSLTSEAWAGILIAGLSESAKGYAVASGLDPGVRVTAATLTAALSQDIDDGACLFDGRTATAQLLQGDVELNENALRGSPQGLSTSVLRFLESDRNLSGISEQSVRDLVQNMQAHRSEIFGGGNTSSDIDGPVVRFIEPVAGSTRGGLVRVTVNATDLSAITEFTFTEPAQATFTSAVFTCTDDTKTDCTLTGNINTDTEPVVAGPTNIGVRVVDASGNPSAPTISFVVNNSIPRITVNDPPAGEGVRGVVEIVAEAEDESGVIDSLTVDIPGFGLCSDQPESPCPDLEPSTGVLRVLWDTTTAPEGNFTLLFEARDGAGQAAPVPHTVVVDNNENTVVNGFVDLGAPVIGATVTALVWDARVRGAVLGTATTDEAGAFSLTMDDQRHASVLLVATGGIFADLATASNTTIDDGQELTVAIGNVLAGQPRNANLNAWTTLAAARAKHTPETIDDNNAIGTNISLISQHLRRQPLFTPFNVSQVKSDDLTTETVLVSDTTAVLALSHAGLSRLAAELSAQANAVGSVTLPELIRVLAFDLSADPLLDGLNLGDPILVSPAAIPITSFTTRFDLAAALDRWLKGTPLQGAVVDNNNSAITSSVALQAGIYNMLADDDRGDLYPGSQPPRPFDVEPPTIELEFGGINSNVQPGEVATGVVAVQGEARDDASDIVSFTATLTADGQLLDDDDGPITDEALSVFIGTDVLPNSADAAEACINAPDADDVALLEDAVCVCAIAEDEQSNIAEKILCFTRALPTPRITDPLPDPRAIFTSGQVRLRATADSGFNLATCVASLTSTPNVAAPALPSITPDGTTCTFESTLPVTSYPDATWTLRFAATDIAGRSANATTSTFIVDDTAPSLSGGLTLTGVNRPIAVVNGRSFIGADNPRDDGPRTSTYEVRFTARDNFAISRAVIRVDMPNGVGPDQLRCIPATQGACGGQTAVFTDRLTSCDEASNCTIGGTKEGDVYRSDISDRGRVPPLTSDDGVRRISVDLFDVNGNRAPQLGGIDLEKDSVAPVFTWKTANQQSFWDDMKPSAGIVPCRTVDQGTDFRSSCIPKPVVFPVDPSVRTGAFFVPQTSETPPQTPTETMHVWRNKIFGSRGDGIIVETTTLPTATAQSVESGTVSVRFQAGLNNCPSARTLTKSKPRTEPFIIKLAQDDLGFDLATVNGARVCLRAVPVDAAGNEGIPADIFVRWDTVDPPLNVLVNPPSDADPLPALAFSSAAADATVFFAGGDRQFSLLHAYVSNPYSFPVNVRLSTLPTLKIDIGDTLSRHVQKSGERGKTSAGNNNGTTGWPGDAGLTMTAPGSNLGSNAAGAVQGWTVSGIDASDDDTGNQIFVKVTDADDPRRPSGLKVADTAPSTGVSTVVNSRDSINASMLVETIRWFSVDAATGLIGAELAVSNNHVSVPAAIRTGAGVFQRTQASVVVAVLVGRAPTGLSYGIVGPNGDIDDPPMLRGEPGVGANSGVNPNITTRRFVVTSHPFMGPVITPNVESETGFFVHARNGNGTLGQRTTCTTPSIATNGVCTFYKRWFELEQIRLVLSVTDPQRVALLKLLSLSTRESGGTINTFSATSAQVEPHPFYADLAVSRDVVRTSNAP